MALTPGSDTTPARTTGNTTTAVGELADKSTIDDIARSLIRVAKQTVLQSGTPSPVLVHSKRSGLKMVEPEALGTTRAQMMATWGVADFTLGQQLYILQTDMSREPIHLPELMIVAHATDHRAPSPPQKYARMTAKKTTAVTCGAET